MRWSQSLKRNLSDVSSRLSTKSIAFEYAQLVLGIIVFYLLLMFPPSPLINKIVVNPYYRLAFLPLSIFFILLFSKTGSTWRALQTAFLFAVFAMTLIYKWQFAHYDGFMIGGLLPWSDAAAYNWEAHRLVNGDLLSTWGGRRPLFSGLLAVLFQLTGDFMITLSILTLFNALAVFFVVRGINQFYGLTAAAVFLVGSVVFYFRYSGVTTSEQLGVAAGHLALFFLLLGVRTGSLKQVLFGLGFLTLALNARAGAFFILPVLILWLAFYFRKTIAFWRSACLAALVVIMVFVSNLIMVRIIADPTSTSFSNYSYTLYGLASGNKGWDQVIKDYPDVTESEVMPLAIEKIRSAPSLIVKGIFRAFGDYFRIDSGAFSFIYRGVFRHQVNLVLWGLVASGLAYSILKWKEGLHSFILASFLGVIFSVPLLPPIDSDKMRVYAATIPLSVLWIAAGISALVAWGRTIFTKHENQAGAEIELWSQPALFFSILFIGLIVSAPLLRIGSVTNYGSSNPLASPVCESGEEMIHGTKFRNVTIFIMDDDETDESYVPFIRISDFQRAIGEAIPLYPFLNDELFRLTPGDQISFGLRMERSAPAQGLFLISKFPVEDEFSVCGRITDNELLRPYSVYYLNSKSEPVSEFTVSQEYSHVTGLLRLIYGMTTGLIFLLLVIGFIRGSK